MEVLRELKVNGEEELVEQTKMDPLSLTKFSELTPYQPVVLKHVLLPE